MTEDELKAIEARGPSNVQQSDDLRAVIAEVRRLQFVVQRLNEELQGIEDSYDSGQWSYPDDDA